jgi:hypothetical protein
MGTQEQPPQHGDEQQFSFIPPRPRILAQTTQADNYLPGANHF